jgi:hypothetical protein
MNDPIKYMIAAGAIACVSMGVGVVIGWELCSDSGRRTGDGANKQPSAVSYPPSSVAGRPSPVIGSKPIQISPSALPVLGGTNLRLGPIRGTNIHLLPRDTWQASVATNGGKRLVASSPTGGMSFSAIQQVQNVPEVKKAREEAAEAQKRYFEAMKKAAEGKK